MKKHVYTLVALAIIAGPLAFSFEPKIHFWTHWPSVFLATLISGLLYILWDVLVTARGHWSFNPVYTGHFRLFGLPLGEYLFFLTVPYACLFVYECVVGYLGQGFLFSVGSTSLYSGAVVFLIAAYIFRKHGYTLLALISVAVLLSSLALSRPGLTGTSEFWISMGLWFLLFLLVNGLYTALPTIYYSPSAIWGIRVGTIPLEDFFYNLSYLGLTLNFYLFFENLFLHK